MNGIHGAQYFDLNMAMSLGYQHIFCTDDLNFIHIHPLGIGMLNVEDQIHLARMASVAKGQDPGAKFIDFLACSLVVGIYLARFQLRDLWFLGRLR